MEETFEHYQDLLDEETSNGGTVMPLRGIRVVEFLNDDGVVGTTWHIDGNPQTREALAMLEIAKLQVGADVVREQIEGD